MPVRYRFAIFEFGRKGCRVNVPWRGALGGIVVRLVVELVSGIHVTPKLLGAVSVCGAGVGLVVTGVLRLCCPNQ
jgi:primosomal protein N'